MDVIRIGLGFVALRRERGLTQDELSELLAASDWLVATEVSFNILGERGSIDILAFHPDTGSPRYRPQGPACA